MNTPEQLAQQFHETYERLAPSFGYKTREASARPWADVPERNKALMIAVCTELLISGHVGGARRAFEYGWLAAGGPSELSESAADAYMRNRGRPASPIPDETAGKVIDLMQALRESLVESPRSPASRE